MKLNTPEKAYRNCGNLGHLPTVLGPVVELAAELKVSFLGMMHFNRRRLFGAARKQPASGAAMLV